MNDNRNPVIEIFNEALQLAPEERAAYLDQACAADSEIRRGVEDLLQAHDQAGDFLRKPVAILHHGSELKSPAGEVPGERIGEYKLLQQIGEGGCGVVFMAEQETPIRRRVALKLVKPGMDTKSVIARFEAERQALALMDHPNIAKIFDAGVTSSGRPFFVMELIRGIKITEYCDQHALSMEARLELFIQVCQAIQHAHHKGIIHRDIKPSNILVTRTTEGMALPVVIDFGVAKAITNQRLTDKTLFTAFEMLIGTPAYMSPEQAALTNVDVDTRTDIYSLGVLLYELLTSSTPFDTAQLLQTGLDEVRRVIREQEPVRPSTRLSHMANAELTKIAKCRQAEPPSLIKTIHGDLDWIVMQALEKDRTRRYETANRLALDVKNFLSNEAVSARPPSKLYKFKKTVARNKVLFACIGIVTLLLLVSLVVVTTALSKERHALLKAKSDQTKAETEATKSRQITRFLEDMLQGVGPSAAMGQDTAMLRGILDRTAERLGKEMTNQPMVEAELRGLIGRLYLEIGKYDQALKMHQAELELRRKLSGFQSAETAAALNNLGQVYWKERKLPEAETTHSEALSIRRHLYGNEHADVAASLNNLGSVYRRQRKLPEAEALTRESLEIRRKLFGDHNLFVADSLRNLSIILVELGKREEAEATGQSMLAIRRDLLGEEHPLVATALNDLAWIVGFSDKTTEAEAMETEAFLIQRKVLGDAHPEVAKSIYSLGGRMRNRGELMESHAVLIAALSIQRKLYGANHPDVLATLRSLGHTLERENRWAEAEPVYREAVESWRQSSGNEHPDTLQMVEKLAGTLLELRKYNEAKRLLDETLTPAMSKRPENARLIMLRLELLGRQKRWREAIPDAVMAIKHLPQEHYRYHQLAGLLAMVNERSVYAQHCRIILETFSDSTDPYIAERMAGDCLLLPDSGVNLQLVNQMATRAVELGSNEGGTPYFYACKSLSEYRLENFSEALRWADKAAKSDEALARAKALAVSAMAQWKLGHKEAAQALLAEGNRLAPQDSTDAMIDLGGTWLAWVFARISLNEATSLIETNASTNAQPSSP